MATYRVRVTAQLSPMTAVDEARVRAMTGASIDRVGIDVFRIDLTRSGRDAACAAERALDMLERALGPSVSFTCPAVWTARRRGPLRLLGRSGGLWHGGDDDDGLAGVREPRRPAPTAGSAAAAADPDVA